MNIHKNSYTTSVSEFASPLKNPGYHSLQREFEASLIEITLVSQVNKYISKWVEVRGGTDDMKTQAPCPFVLSHMMEVSKFKISIEIFHHTIFCHAP